MMGPDLSASRSWDSGACTQLPAEPPASATMRIDKDSISQPSSFTFFFLFPHFSFSFTVGDADRLLCYSLIISSAAWEISHKLFTFYTLNLNCKSA
jgi:hypothetical protein